MTAVVVVEAVAIGVLGVLVFSLLRTQAQLVAAVRQGVWPSVGHRPGSPAQPQVLDLPAPALHGVALNGQETEWSPDGPAVLAFLTSSCSSCGWWWTQLRGSARLSLPGLVVVTPDPETDSPVEVRDSAGHDLRILMSSDGWTDYGVGAGSTFVVVDAGRIRARGPAADWDELMALLSAGLSG